jgi:hypothetical protein
MRGVVSGDDVSRLRSTTMQGSIVSGYTEYGQCVYEGRLAAIPKLAQDGSATIVAQGRVAEAQKRQSRLLFYTTKGSTWSNPILPPFNRDLVYTGDPGVKIDMEFTDNENGISDIPSQFPEAVGKGSFSWITPTGYLTANSVTALRYEALIYIPEARIRRVRAFGSVDHAGHTFQVLTIGSPSEPAVLIANITADESGTVFNPGVQGWFDVTIPGEGTPGIILALNAPTNASTVRSPFQIWGLQVWGESTGDIIYAEEAADTIATRLGWDPAGISGIGAVDIRPLDWIGAWDGLVNYVAGFEDARWGVYEDERGYGPRLEFGPWGRRHWEVSSAGASWDLEPLEIFNRVVVAYVSDDGKDQQFILDADPDPLAAVGLINEARTDMNDRQGAYDLAARYAHSTLGHISQQLYSGRISLVSAIDTASGMDAPYEIRAGDFVTIRDFNGSETLTVRAADVEYTPGMVSVGVNEAAVPISGANASSVGTRPLPPSAPVDERTSQPSESHDAGGLGRVGTYTVTQYAPGYFQQHW